MNALPVPLRQKLLAQSTDPCMQSAAGRSGLAFFASGFAAPQPASPLTDLNKRASALTPCLQAILDRPVGIPRWGINE